MKQKIRKTRTKTHFVYKLLITFFFHIYILALLPPEEKDRSLQKQRITFSPGVIFTVFCRMKSNECVPKFILPAAWPKEDQFLEMLKGLNIHPTPQGSAIAVCFPSPPKAYGNSSPLLTAWTVTSRHRNKEQWIFYRLSGQKAVTPNLMSNITA